MCTFLAWILAWVFTFHVIDEVHTRLQSVHAWGLKGALAYTIT